VIPQARRLVIKPIVMKQIFTRSRSLVWIVPLVWGGMSLAGGTAQAQNSPSQYNVLFVDPNRGDDTQSGSEQVPFRTITRALQAASPNTIIRLASGTYSRATGEIFPLQLRSGITLQGDPRTRGQAVVIQGGGGFLSRSFARQNVAIVGANRAGLTGVTVSNPSPQGYGLWVESTNPVVVDSTFTGSDHDGVSVVGNSTPILRNNYFYQNGANGITIYGTSRPLLQDNIFERTGFGINVAQNAAPRILNNRVTQNKDGIVVQGNAQPILRNNVIDSNDRDGLVAIAQSLPDLGTAADPGGNTFQNNRQFDINAQVNRQMLPAFGNQLSAAQTSGKIDFAGNPPTSAPVATRPLPALIAQVKAKQSPRLAPPVTPEPGAISIPVPAPHPLAPPSGSATPLGAVTQSGSGPREITFSRPNLSGLPIAQPAPSVTPQPVPMSVPRATATPLPTGLPIIGSFRRLPTPVDRTKAIGPIQPAPQAIARTSIPNAAPPGDGILPVPGGNAPIGNVGNASSVPLWRGPTQQSEGSPPVPPHRTSGLGLRYRVVVDAESEAQQAQVRAIVPEAFLTSSGGRSVMQAGAFSDRAKADQLLEALTNQGLRAAVENL
jgi:parallel beta-helix repeat protein